MPYSLLLVDATRILKPCSMVAIKKTDQRLRLIRLVLSAFETKILTVRLLAGIVLFFYSNQHLHSPLANAIRY
jgi:hypothetical protein